jgi:hypothetical protein
MRLFLQWTLFAALLLAPCTAMARRHDPLTSDEIDQLREVALEPEKRLKLYADFARLRFTAIENARTPKKPDAGKPDAENPRSLHDLMEDFLAVYDELDENISMYDDRQADLRKAMKIVLLADNEFHARLEGLQHNLTPEERTDCDFVLSSIVEAVTTGTAGHKKLLQEQEVSLKNKKKK